MNDGIVVGVPVLTRLEQNIDSQNMLRVQRIRDEDYWCNVESVELSKLYDAIVRKLQRSPPGKHSSVMVMRTKSNDTDMVYTTSVMELERILNERLVIEHGIAIKRLQIERYTKCMHRFCDCGCEPCVDIPCILWNCACACIPLIYWIPRINEWFEEEEWCVTADIVLSDVVAVHQDLMTNPKACLILPGVAVCE